MRHCHILFLIILTEPPTHALLHFEVDSTVSILPVKRIAHPPLPELTEGCTCRVRWSKRKQYDASVLCLGMNLVETKAFFVCHCFFNLSGDTATVTKKKSEWVLHHQEKATDQKKSMRKSEKGRKKRKLKVDKVTCGVLH